MLRDGDAHTVVGFAVPNRDMMGLLPNTTKHAVSVVRLWSIPPKSLRPERCIFQMSSQIFSPKVPPLQPAQVMSCLLRLVECAG